MQIRGFSLLQPASVAPEFALFFSANLMFTILINKQGKYNLNIIIGICNPCLTVLS